MNTEGRLLVFPVADLPEMARGGQPDLRHPWQEVPHGRGALVAAIVVAPDRSLVVRCGDRSMTLTWKELQEHLGARAQRGAVLSRNYRKVTRLTVE